MKNICVLITLSIVLFYSTLNAQWVPTNGPGTGAAIRCFAVNGTDVFAGSWGSSNGYSGGVYLSTNEGANWMPLNTGLTDTAVFAIVPKDTKLFTGTLGGGVFTSTNNGVNWIAANNGLTNIDVISFAVSGPNIFCGTYGGVFLSTNNGANWIEVNNGLPIATPFIVNSLTFIDNNLFAGTAGYGVFLSTDNGANWIEKNNGLTNTAVLTLAVSGSNIFAGTFSGVFVSTDNGTNWINTQGLAGVIVESLITIGPNIFAGSSGGGVYLSTNNGSNWTSVGTGIPNTIIYAFAIRGSKIFAGTLSGIVYKRELSEIITSVESISTDLPNNFSLSQNYPNPFNPSTSIQYRVASISKVSLKVYDILGNEVAILVNEEKPAGSYELKFDAAGLSSGMYFYKLQAGNFVETKKMLLMK